MAGIRPDKLSVSDIKSRLLNIAQTSLYRLTLPVPADVRTFVSQRGINTLDIDNISLLCSEANLPGSTLATHDVTNDYHGVSEKMVYRRMYDETAYMTFYVDRNYKVVEFFESWIDYITGVGEVFTRKQFESPYVHHRMSYPDDYKINMYLTKFEKDHGLDGFSTTLEYTFVRAFPISITSMPVSYDQSQLLKCNVSFSFIRYVMNRTGTSRVGSYSDARASGVAELNSLNRSSQSAEDSLNSSVISNTNTSRSSNSRGGIPGLSDALNSSVINDINGSIFPLGSGIPGLTGILNPENG